jgi:hypothetical protein
MDTRSGSARDTGTRFWGSCLLPRAGTIAAIVSLSLSACGGGNGGGGGVDDDGGIEFPKIDRHPPPWPLASRGPLAAMPTYDPAATNPGQIDLRGFDLSALDLRGSQAELEQADFDDRTVWPPAERMPADFNGRVIMELGKNPGLRIRSLHEQGITGRGVGIAIIDQPLLVDHQEYTGRLRLYEEINIWPNEVAGMHGAGVASIAAGQTVGVAPDADLYYIGSTNSDEDASGGTSTRNWTYYAQAVRRILAVNAGLPASQRIRVLAMQVRWYSGQKGYDEIMAAVKDAGVAGIFVVSSSLEETSGLKFHGLGRDPLADPDTFESYQRPTWSPAPTAAGYDLSLYVATDRLLVPMDARAIASPNGNDEYVFYRRGGWSWAIPYIAGVYALACQVDPTMTPERFWALAMQTGRTIQVTDEGQSYILGPILDPTAFLAVP